MSAALLRRRYHLVLGFFITGLILSGLTAFPLLHELRLMAAALGIELANARWLPSAAGCCGTG